MVSSATGFLDFVSYMAAAASTKVTASMVGYTGWDGLILLWLSLMIVGVFVALPYGKNKNGRKATQKNNE